MNKEGGEEKGKTKLLVRLQGFKEFEEEVEREIDIGDQPFSFHHWGFKG